MCSSGKVEMTEFLESRRAESDKRVAQLLSRLNKAQKHAGPSACVYLTGSFGRGEASPHSDLDLFILARSDESPRRPSRLQEICLKADLIEQTSAIGLPEFSGDGEYLALYTVDKLVKTLGCPNDDASNTFTARLLLLLESRPLIGKEVYDEAVHEVLKAYWRDYDDHPKDFMPTFLANDIARLWRTFCVNYEARTTTDPPEKKAKRKLKNYKLKHSRLLTCYSALAYLLAVHKARGTVNLDDATQMVGLRPLERLTALVNDAKLGTASARQRVDDVLESYCTFLRESDRAEAELLELFLKPQQAREYFAQANTMGDRVFELMLELGEGSRFFRLLVV